MIKNINTIIIFKYYIILFPLIYLTGPAISDGLIVISSITFLVLIILKKEIIIKNKELKALFLLFFLFLLFSVSFIFNFNSKSFIEYVLYLRFFVFLFLLIHFLKYFDEIDYTKIFKIWIFVYIFVLLDTLLQYYLGVNIFGFEPDQSFDGYNQISRLTGIFRNEPIVGTFLSKFLIIPVGYFIIKYNSNNKNYLIFFLIFLSTFAILVSTQRAAIIYLILFFIFLFLLIIRSCKFNVILSIKSISLLLIPLILFNIIAINSFDNTYKERILSTFVEISKLKDKDVQKIDKNQNFANKFSFYDYYVNSSYAKLYMTALKLYGENKYLGLGFKNYRNVCREYQKDLENFKSYLCSTHPHNYYVELFVENGIFGIIFILIILFLLFENFKKNFFNTNNSLQIVFVLCLFIYLWPLVPTGSFTNNYNSVMFWYLFGIALGVKSKV